MGSLAISLCAQPLRSLISMLTALVSSRARVKLRRRLCLSMGYSAQSGEPRCLPGWSGCLLAGVWLNSEVPPGNPVYPQTLHLPQAPPYTDAPPAYSEVLPVN